MVNSVGTKLQQARMDKHLSIEESSRITRIRPDKLIDLEEDNYSNFPSMSYAKGFLLLYARFLDVDVHEFADTLHSPNPVSSDDYEYLNAAASGPPPPSSRRSYHFSPRRQHIVLPILVFALLAGAIALGLYVVVSFQRLGPIDDLTDKKEPAASPSASPPISALAVPSPALRPPAPSIVEASPTPATPSPTPAPISIVPSPSPTPPAPSPASTFDPTREVRRAEPVFPSPHAAASVAPTPLPPIGSGPAIASVVPVASPEPAASPEAIKQLTINPIRKTKVTIRKDVAGSPPIFEDWLYPGDGPLKLRGRKFWIQVQDPAAVRITQDGQPLPADQSDIQIE